MAEEQTETAPEAGAEPVQPPPDVSAADGEKIIESAAEAAELHARAGERRNKGDQDAFARAMEAMGGEPEVSEPKPEVSEPKPEAAPAESKGAEAAAETGAPEPGPEAVPQERARWAALTQAEQRITQQRREMKADMEALRQERAKFEAKLQGLAKLDGGDAVGGLADLGISYNDLTASVLKSGDPSQKIEPHLEPLQKQLAEMETRLKAREEAVAQRDQQQQMAGVMTTIRATIEGGKEERYELLSSYPNAEHEVFTLIKTEWERAGSPSDLNGNPQATLTREQAADRLEAHLLEEATSRLSAKKVRALLENGAKQTQKTPAAPSANQGQKTGRKRPKTQTLTNNQSGQVARTGGVDYSAAACRARALEAMQEEGE